MTDLWTQPDDVRRSCPRCRKETAHPHGVVGDEPHYVCSACAFEWTVDADGYAQLIDDTGLYRFVGGEDVEDLQEWLVEYYDGPATAMLDHGEVHLGPGGALFVMSFPQRIEWFFDDLEGQREYLD